jgi:hypothetical protein
MRGHVQGWTKAPRQSVTEEYRRHSSKAHVQGTKHFGDVIDTALQYDTAKCSSHQFPSTHLPASFPAQKEAFVSSIHSCLRRSR